MSKKSDINAFHETLIEVAKYLIVMNPDITQYYNFEDYEHDQYPHNRQRYKYHRLVLQQLERNEPALMEDLEHCYGIRLVKVIGGNDGQDGMPHYYIFKFKGKLFKLPAHYSSYNDSPLYWNDMHEVVELERTITIYKRTDGESQESEEFELYSQQVGVEDEEDSFE